eukprot:scaffold2141_cov350-Prasinococcus_capsulatus_cf.AAC.1
MRLHHVEGVHKHGRHHRRACRRGSALRQRRLHLHLRRRWRLLRLLHGLRLRLPAAAAAAAAAHGQRICSVRPLPPLERAQRRRYADGRGAPDCDEDVTR